MSAKGAKATYTFADIIVDQTNVKVHKATSSDGGETVVVRIDSKRANFEKDRVMKVLEKMKTIEHAKVPRLIEVFEDSSSLYSVWSFFDGVPLKELFLSMRTIPEAKARSLFTQLLDFTGDIHQMGIAHRHLTWENVLVDKSMNICVVGWWHMAMDNNAEVVTDKLELRQFDPPEAFLKTPTASLFYDYWSLGVLLYVIVASKLPWAGDSNDEVHHAMTAGNVKKPTCSQACYDLIVKLLNTDPVRRFSPRTAKSHLWLTNPVANVNGARRGSIAAIARPKPI